MSKICVVGGAGYIGSHMINLLKRSGYTPVVLDDLSSGFRDAVHGAELVVGTIADRNLLVRLFNKYTFEAVIHFGSFIQVSESITNPAKYYDNNLAATLTLLDAMMIAGISRFIFSSTAAVYGVPVSVPINESHPKFPINPYGRCKWMVEQILEDYDYAYGLKSICLRYFNAAGADPDAGLGERHDPETHLIPLVLQAASGRREAITVYGTNYDTPDGTCIRDYIHVTDLCEAHLVALHRLIDSGGSARYNLGNGLGYSVNEIIESARKITGKEIQAKYEQRRPGDPPRLIADSRLANSDLGWHCKRSGLDSIIADAWRWELKYPWGT